MQTQPNAAAPVAQRLTWTVEEAATLLGISRATAYEAAKTGALPHIKIGRRILVPVAAIECLLAKAAL
jgi:excisionase family DNA binding protein